MAGILVFGSSNRRPRESAFDPDLTTSEILMRLGNRREDPSKPAKPPSSPEYRAMHMKLGYLAIAVIINVIGFSILFPLAPYYIARALGPGVNVENPRI